MRSRILFVGLTWLATEFSVESKTNLIQIAEWASAGGIQHLGDRAFLSTTVKPGLATNAFLALPADCWEPGFVPIYAIERDGRFELRRLPLRGEENQSEPLFFALPPGDEPATVQLTGQWRCSATRGDASDSWFIWQLTLVGETISARFDPSSDYRVVSIRSGTFRSNRFELWVDYINDAYHLQGEWSDGKLRGRWEKTDREESGQWQAIRDPGSVPEAWKGAAVPLHEWRRKPDGPLHYSVSHEPPGPDWTRARDPICRVWRIPVQRPPVSPTKP